MSVLLPIILNVIFPVFLLMGMGVFLHRLFKFDLKTLSKITTYYLLPVVGFVNVYNSEISGRFFSKIIGFQLILCLLLIGMSTLLAKALKLNKGMAANFKNSIGINAFKQYYCDPCCLYSRINFLITLPKDWIYVNILDTKKLNTRLRF